MRAFLRTKVWLKNEEAFSLVELLAALTILSLIIAPLLFLFLTSIDTVIRGGAQTIAVNLAQDKLEHLKDRGFYNLITEYLVEGNSPEIELEIDGYEGYTRRTSVQLEEIEIQDAETTEPYILEVLHLEVIVSWQNKENEWEVVLESYLADR
ncbi:MAG: type IV pilus modification PilV family protein [Dethiobacteria bacterium]|nr:type II secretion system protein [Bacillota bacterium]